MTDSIRTVCFIVKANFSTMLGHELAGYMRHFHKRRFDFFEVVVRHLLGFVIFAVKLIELVCVCVLYWRVYGAGIKIGDMLVERRGGERRGRTITDVNMRPINVHLRTVYHVPSFHLPVC